MGFGSWGYALHRNGTTLPHTPGGGSIALRATDAIRFPYLLLHKGKWGNQQLVPADYVAHVSASRRLTTRIRRWA